MWLASSRVRSLHEESCVPQYPQNLLEVVDVNGDEKVRWILECVSSGNCANVAEVYHCSGTRSQRVSGLAECWPAETSALVYLRVEL